jgi:hypothetical protein
MVHPQNKTNIIYIITLHYINYSQEGSEGVRTSKGVKGPQLSAVLIKWQLFGYKRNEPFKKIY